MRRANFIFVFIPQHRTRDRSPPTSNALVPYFVRSLRADLLRPAAQPVRLMRLALKVCPILIRRRGGRRTALPKQGLQLINQLAIFAPQ